MILRRNRFGLCPLAVWLFLSVLSGSGCESNSGSRGTSSGSGADSVARAPKVVDPLDRATVKAGTDYEARLRTRRGTVTLSLFAEDAPYTVSNFIYLANVGFYNGLTFHRVVPGFVAQAGDPTGTGNGGPGYLFADEIGPRKHLRGTIAMANQGRPDTNGSQFFICLVDLPSLDGRHTIFGRVTSGMDVVDRLESGDQIVGVDILQRAEE